MEFPSDACGVSVGGSRWLYGSVQNRLVDVDPLFFQPFVDRQSGFCAVERICWAA
jgi:hypothetical protein